MQHITQADLVELKRIYTNTYDADKAHMNRVMNGITMMNREITSLKAEVERLTKELEAAKEK